MENSCGTWFQTENPACAVKDLPVFDNSRTGESIPHKTYQIIEDQINSSESEGLKTKHFFGGWSLMRYLAGLRAGYDKHVYSCLLKPLPPTGFLL